MTKRRFDAHSTEFGLWLREQPEIDSSRGYVATNVDYIWKNYDTLDWMIIEEKRHGSQPKNWQTSIFLQLDALCKANPHYHGFHVLVFENTSPDDGLIWLDGKEIVRDELIAFLQFA